MDLTIREIPDVKRYERMNSAELRESYLLDTLFHKGKVSLVYIDQERTVLGGIVPDGSPLKLACPEELRAAYFTERREIGVMNIGDAGTIAIDGKKYIMAHRDALYIGKGSQDITFKSDNAKKPAKYYLVSYPAHSSYPTRHARIQDAEPLHLGSDEECNKRIIYKYIYEGGIKSCQLVMGFTELAPGNVWNTMPAHKHLRRTEVYLYYNLAEDAAVFHLMGKPDETRHLVIRNEQAVFSPAWSIHSGSGTRNYSFIWAMGGENKDFTDMDAIGMDELR